MVRESVDVLELLRKQASGADLDFLREAVAVLAEAVMDQEVSAQVGAGYGERSEMRTTRRNGYRQRRWDTRVGSIDLQIPKLRQGRHPMPVTCKWRPHPGSGSGRRVREAKEIVSSRSAVLEP